MYKYFLFINLGLLLAFASSLQAKELSAYEIMREVDTRYDGDTRSSEALLVLIDKKDRQRIRKISMMALETEELEKNLMVFRSPADVKGTSYMSYDWENTDKEDDSWLYLPAMQKIRRVAASDESGAFMGSDFSYADINGLELDDFTYELEKPSEMVDGHDCWVIRSTPVNDKVIKETGYTSSTSWVRKDIFIQVKAIIKVKKGKRIKYFSVKDLKKIDNIWTAHTLQMVTTKKGKKEHSSILKISNVIYNKNIDENLFDTGAMQRGL